MGTTDTAPRCRAGVTNRSHPSAAAGVRWGPQRQPRDGAQALRTGHTHRQRQVPDGDHRDSLSMARKRYEQVTHIGSGRCPMRTTGTAPQWRAGVTNRSHPSAAAGARWGYARAHKVTLIGRIEVSDEDHKAIAPRYRAGVMRCVWLLQSEPLHYQCPCPCRLLVHASPPYLGISPPRGLSPRPPVTLSSPVAPLASSCHVSARPTH